jgi:hypothetical protein
MGPSDRCPAWVCGRDVSAHQRGHAIKQGLKGRFLLRSLLINPLLLAILAIVGVFFCRTVGWNPHLHEMLLAVGVCAAACELALVPLILTRGASQIVVSQAGLGASVLHMMIAALAGLGLAMSQHLSPVFTYWLMLFYWSTLIAVSAIAVRAVRSAPISTGTP